MAEAKRCEEERGELKAVVTGEAKRGEAVVKWSIAMRSMVELG
jgi:hypothetical protein